MGQRLRTAALAALTISLAAGCADAGKGTPATGTASASAATSTPPGPPWYDNVAPAAAATKVGASRTPCVLPVIFDLPDRWLAKPVEVTGEWAALTEWGGSTMRCEIDAKPAGNIGFLRVWTVDDDTVPPRQALEEFLADYGTLTEVQYRDTKAGSISAIEASFLRKDELDDEATRGAALMVETPLGAVLLTLGGFDNDEVEEMMPAYQLAKQTFAVKR